MFKTMNDFTLSQQCVYDPHVLHKSTACCQLVGQKFPPQNLKHSAQNQWPALSLKYSTSLHENA